MKEWLLIKSEISWKKIRKNGKSRSNIFSMEDNCSSKTFSENGQKYFTLKFTKYYEIMFKRKNLLEKCYNSKKTKCYPELRSILRPSQIYDFSVVDYKNGGPKVLKYLEHSKKCMILNET